MQGCREALVAARKNLRARPTLLSQGQNLRASRTLLSQAEPEGQAAEASLKLRTRGHPFLSLEA